MKADPRRREEFGFHRSDQSAGGARDARAGIVALVAAFMLVLPASIQAQSGDLQQQIRDSQLRLEQIRAERAQLQREMEAAQSQVQDAAAELRNIERQISASRSVVAEMEFQTDAISSEVADGSVRLVETRERLREGDAVLRRRLRDIYKLGPLHTVRVLLGAESFTDLLNRYRYLSVMAAYDRTLVAQVRDLEGALAAQNLALQENLQDLERLRQVKLGEVAQLSSVERDRQVALQRYRESAQSASTRLEQKEADIGRLTSLVDDLEERRRAAERRLADAGTASSPASLSPADAGTLSWPVDGDILYRFGREQRPNGTVLRWNGVGIAATVGTPVVAVRSGIVVLAGPFEGYGPTVVVSHGDGYYTLYLYLDEIGVVEGRDVQAGQVVGTVGGGGTPEGPHLEFQIRAPVNGGAPQARDPLQWLRPRGQD